MVQSLPESLPDAPSGRAWPETTKASYEMILREFHIAARNLQQMDDHLQLKITIENLVDIRPLVVGLRDDGVDPDWVENVARSLVDMQAALEDAASSRYVTSQLFHLNQLIWFL
jgi:hypothetical protein